MIDTLLKATKRSMAARFVITKVLGFPPFTISILGPGRLASARK
jgi:hypothetical protein